MIKTLLAACLLSGGAFSLVAHAALLPPRADSIESTQLHQKRAIEVYLPEGYDKEPARRYETIYVLDGDWNARLVVQTVDFLQATGWMPPVIVVGVPNFFDAKGVNSRDHDLTPSAQPDQPGSGGAGAFIAFLKTELIPYVGAHYPGSGVNVIHGHSYGGLFLNHLIATDPTIFDGYLILDPAMWWGEKEVVAQLAEKLPSTPTKGEAIFIAGREGSAYKGMGIDGLVAAYAQAPRALHRQIVAYPNETHDSMKFKGTYDGLRYLYRGWSQDPLTIGPDDGVVDPARPFPLEADTDRFDIHYTTDGSMPTLDSPRMDHSLAVADPAALRLKSIATRDGYDTEVPLHLRTGVMWKPARAAKPGEESTSRYRIYARDRWPTFRGAPLHTGSSDDGDLGKVAPDDFAAITENDTVFTEDGYYIFVLRTSNPARVLLDGKPVIVRGDSDDRSHRTFAAPLQAGVHRVRLEFLHRKGDGFDFNVFQYRNGTWDNVVK